MIRLLPRLPVALLGAALFGCASTPPADDAPASSSAKASAAPAHFPVARVEHAPPPMQTVTLPPGAFEAHGKPRRATSSKPVRVARTLASTNSGGIAGRASPTSFASYGGDSVGLYNVPGDAVATDSASNQGGTVATNASIELVFWGSAWNTSTPSSAAVTQTFDKLANSTYFSALSQYGVKSVSIRGAITIANAPPSTFSFDDVGDMTWNLIDSGLFPDVDDAGGQIIYMFFMPQSATYADAANVRGSHGDYSNDRLLDWDYAWVGWTGFGTMDYITNVATHELVESITDPAFNEQPAWVMSRTINGGDELGDACNDTGDYLDGIFVQAYWSQAHHACAIPFTPAPTITSVAPIIGSNAGGGVITVTGSNFDTLGGTTEFFFGSTPATSVSCSSTTQCSMTSPAGNGVVDVTAKVNDFTSATSTEDQFYYTPSIISVTPANAYAGDTVSIYGWGLGTAPTTIAFGTTSATNVSCASTNLGDTCTATVPGGAGAVHVVATVGGHTTTETAADLFTYGALTVTSIDRSHGGMGGGEILGVVGTGFEPCPYNTAPTNMKVFFGNVQATRVYCDDNRRLAVYSPPATGPGAVDVTVFAFGETSVRTSADIFTYTAYPEIEGFGSSWAGSVLSGSIEMDGVEPSDTLITLTSSQPGAVMPPAHVTVPAGQSSVWFPMTVGTFNASSLPLVTATYDGPAYSISVNPPPVACTRKCTTGSYLDEETCLCVRCKGTSCS